MRYNISPLRVLIKGYGERKVSEMLSRYKDCVGSDQESFLRNNAIMIEKKNMCRTYIALDENSDILGYFSIGLRCMRIPKPDDNHKDFGKKMNIDPESRVAQSYLIGQLSRSENTPKGFGSTLMSDAIEMICDANLIVGCRLVRVDCDNDLISYYSRYGFALINRVSDDCLNQMAYILRTESVTTEV